MYFEFLILLSSITIFPLIIMFTRSFRVLSISLADFNGYPTFIIKFRSRKYPIRFVLYSSIDGVIQSVTAYSGWIVELYLPRFKNITYLCKFIIKAYINDREVFSKDFIIHGLEPHIIIEHVNTTVSPIGLSIMELVLKVFNKSNYFLYITSNIIEVYSNDVKVHVSLSKGYEIVLPFSEKYIFVKPVINYSSNDVCRENRIKVKLCNSEVSYVISPLAPKMRVLKIDYDNNVVKSITLSIMNNWLFSIHTRWIKVYSENDEIPYTVMNIKPYTVEKNSEVIVYLEFSKLYTLFPQKITKTEFRINLCLSQLEI